MSHFTRIYIDTEFTDLIDMHLISIACVSDDGDEFYSELADYPTEACNAFVREAVLPHLGKTPGATMTRDRLRESLNGWLNQVRGERELVVASYDYSGDWSLLIEAIGEAPAWLRPDNVRDRVDEYIREAFFKIAHGKRHHALWDARALRRGYSGKNQ